MPGSKEDTGNAAVHEFALSVTPETCDYVDLRQQFGGWLEGLGVERSMVDDWRLILTELATNACDATPSGGTITCVATSTHNRLELSVTNPTEGEPTIKRAPAFDPQSESGGGLFIVDAIVHGMEYDIRSDSVTIRCWTPLQRR